MEILTDISRSLQKGDDTAVRTRTRQALAKKISPQTILNQGLIAGMEVVGNRFRNHEIFLPDVLLAARAMNSGVEEIKPLLIKGTLSSRGKVIIGTVQGDLHDIGKNLVGIMLKGAGFEVIDLGNDVSVDRFIQAARNEKAAVIGMSALLTTTMPVMKEVVQKVKEENLGVKTIIGGAPVSEEYAREIGADAYGFDAGYAVEKINQIIN